MKDILAIVDGTEIKNSDLDSIIERYPTEKRIYFETEQGRKQLLEQKIAFALMSRSAKEKNIDKSEEFLRKLEEIKEQMLTQIVMTEMFSEIKVSDDEVREAYEANKDKFIEDECVGARHILMKDEAELQKIREKILSGDISFEDAAKQYSDCPSKEKGGDLGLFKKGMMVKEFEDVAFTIPLNEVSDLVKTQFGYHLIKVEEKREKRQLEFDEVKKNLQPQIMEQKQQKAYEDKLEELKKKYNVEIFE